MSRFVLVLVALGVVFLVLSAGEGVSAQDCERAIPGNSQSPCKRLDFLDGIQPPTFTVEQFTDDEGKYYCRGVVGFKSTTLLKGRYSWTIRGSETKPSTRSLTDTRYYDYNSVTSRYDHISVPGGERRLVVGDYIYLHSSVPKKIQIVPYLWVYAIFEGQDPAWDYFVVSAAFKRPKEVADYQLLMNQCLAGITRQLEHEAALEAARKQAEEDRVRAETAAEEAQNKAELAAIELQSAQDALQAQETLNAGLLQETILSIKREDAIRAAWQQVILVRMAGLEERTEIWGEAVSRWTEEDLQFSSAMEARIQEVERLQTLNAALEQSMVDQRRLLIARLKDLEKAEQEALESRNPIN